MKLLLAKVYYIITSLQQFSRVGLLYHLKDEETEPHIAYSDRVTIHI